MTQIHSLGFHAWCDDAFHHASANFGSGWHWKSRHLRSSKQVDLLFRIMATIAAARRGWLKTTGKWGDL